MKRGTTVRWDYDLHGDLALRIDKKRGKLTRQVEHLEPGAKGGDA